MNDKERIAELETHVQALDIAFEAAHKVIMLARQLMEEHEDAVISDMTFLHFIDQTNVWVRQKP